MLMMMKKNESLAMLALFMTMVSCVPMFHHQNDTANHAFFVAKLRAINVTRVQHILHTAKEMISRAGICNATMAAKWKECGPCVLDPCVIVLTHNCSYGSDSKHHDPASNSRFHHWFYFFKHLGQYHKYFDLESTSEEDHSGSLASKTCQAIQHNETACFEVHEKCVRCKEVQLDACIARPPQHNSTV